MDEEKLSPDLERQWLEVFKQAALRDFPNPERIGCPGAEFLRALATDRSLISASDPRLEHVTHCSPCFREFTGFREEVANLKRRNRQLLIATTGALFILGVAGYYERDFIAAALSGSSGRSDERYVAASYDLKDWSVVRGPGQSAPAPRAEIGKLPHKRLDLTVTLPFASDAGEYEVQVLRPSGTPLVSTSGLAHIENGSTLLRIKLDLSRLPPGEYKLGVRRARWDWTTHPVIIE